MTPTDQRIQEIRERVEKASRGPWKLDRESEIVGPLLGTEGFRKIIVGQKGDTFMREEDAEFIAAARSDIPFLLDQLERHKIAIKVAKEYVSHMPKAVAHLDIILNTDSQKEKK